VSVLDKLKVAVKGRRKPKPHVPKAPKWSGLHLRAFNRRAIRDFHKAQQPGPRPAVRQPNREARREWFDVPGTKGTKQARLRHGTYEVRDVKK